MISERERVVRRRLATDFAHYASKCLYLRGKQGGLLPFRLNAAQHYIHAALEKQKQDTGRVRAMILKGRQQGCSTYVAGRFYWRVTQERGQVAFIFTHVEEAARNVLGMVQRFHDHCPRLMRPQASRLNARGMTFNRLDSAYRIGSAHAKGTGRAQTIQYFHGSEVAFWPHADEHVAGVLQAVPDAAGTEVILESTSNGAAGAFYDFCHAAMAGQSEYQFIFVPWFWQGEYHFNALDGFVPTVEEQEYGRQHRLEPSQLYWRRRKISQLGATTFRREYPATPAEAFAADNPAALWSRTILEKNRKTAAPVLRRTVIAVDPAVSANSGSDETGIIVAGLGHDGDAYILADLSGKYTPGQWAAAVHRAYHQFTADRVIAEVNQGGALVEHTLRALDDRIPYKSVHASRGKIARAEPVAALDEQGRVHHIGLLPVLEDQMCAFEPGHLTFCDRVDARVWAVTELLLGRPVGGPVMWA